MKLNLGSGFNKLAGYINIDCESICEPDQCFNLEAELPLSNDYATELVLHHTLEHLGDTAEKFINIIKEFYRISQDGCIWKITVPHYNSDIFHIDPTHVRKIHPMTMRMFDQQDNVKDLKNRGHYTKLGLLNAVDIQVIKEVFYLTEPWNTQAHSGKITNEEINFAGSHYNNICSEIYLECLVHKPERHPYESIKHLFDVYSRKDS